MTLAASEPVSPRPGENTTPASLDAALLPKRIRNLQSRKTPKVLVGGEDLIHAVLDQEGGNMCIVEDVTTQRGGAWEVVQDFLMALSFRDEHYRSRVHKRFDGFPGFWCRRGRVENSGMRDDSEVFVNTRPGEHPGL